MALRVSTGFRNRMMGLADEKITNGGFDSTTTGWTAVNASLASVASGQAGNALEISESGGANPGKAYQDITVDLNNTYVFTGYFKKGTADNGKIMIGTTGVEAYYWDSGNLSDAAWAKKAFAFIPEGTTVRITLQTNDATIGETSYFDTVSVVTASGSFGTIFNEGLLKIYSGSQPTLADDAPSGTLLVTISDAGTGAGLEWNTVASGAITKKTAQTWSGTCVATGTAGWARLTSQNDSGGSSTSDERVDFAVGTSGTEIIVSSTAFTNGAVESINSATITFPAS
jgi:hypothetical protein